MNFCVLISRSDIAEQSGDVSQSVSGPTLMRFILFLFFWFGMRMLHFHKDATIVVVCTSSL